MRVLTTLYWLHLISTDKLTYYLVHDCWSPYFNFDFIRHGLCNAHLLRELTGVLENTNQSWAKDMRHLLGKLNKATRMPENWPSEVEIQTFEQEYRQILELQCAL
jgi:transposase